LGKKTEGRIQKTVFCEFNGKIIINYCWGNQVGTEFIAEAEYAGAAAQFLSGWFPDR